MKAYLHGMEIRGEFDFMWVMPYEEKAHKILHL
jgi:hypothetical protein